MPNNHDLAPLHDIAFFQAVADAGGFRAAAKRLNVSPSTVSETISRLERHLNVPLFTRTTRSLRLTETGRALVERLSPLLNEARAALDDAASSRNQIRGSLKLNVPMAVMIDILPPLLDAFMTRHPDVRVEVMVEDRLIDITAADCDAGIRYGEHLAKDMIAVPIGPRWQAIGLAASPAYLAQHPAPQHPQDILQHDCIRTRFANGALTSWEFEKGDELIKIDPMAKLVMTTGSVAANIDLALAGHGLIHTFRNWLDPHIASGALVALLPDWWPSFSGPQLYYSSRFVPAPLRAFIDFIAEKRERA